MQQFRGMELDIDDLYWLVFIIKLDWACPFGLLALALTSPCHLDLLPHLPERYHKWQ